MADLFLHLPFARRLRLAEGLHPLIGETLTRRQPLVALGATLPLLPGVERKGMSFFRRLFSGGGEAARWQKQLAPQAAPRVELIKRFIVDSGIVGGLGPMSRLALGLGVLSHELLEHKLAGLSPTNPSEKAAVERAQARLWCQAAIPNNLEAEWRAVGELADAELHKRTFEHIDAALKAAFGQGPGKDALLRWARGLGVEVTPAVQTGLPPSLSLQDHAARGPHFENNSFVARANDALSWFVLLANRFGERCTAGTLDAVSVVDALTGGRDGLLENDPDAGAARDRSTAWIVAKRKDTLERGRNDKPAFIEGLGETKPIHRSNAFTGMMNLSDIPSDQLPPELQQGAPLPPPSQVLAPPVPAATMEVSLAQIEAMANAGARPNLPPLPLDASGPLQAAPMNLPPALTQEISIAQIEGEAKAFATPAMTQEISAVQIEGQEPNGGFATPAMTQEISALQIESTSTANGAHGAPQPNSQENHHPPRPPSNNEPPRE